MQQDLLTVTSVEAARGLQNMGFLSYFLEPTSPSDVAKKMDIAANLAHHHAKKALELGLLLKKGREGGNVLYQLAARTFRYSRDLLPLNGSDDPVAEKMKQLESRFLHEYQRCDALWSGPEGYYNYAGFGSQEKPPLEVPPTPSSAPLEGIAAHFHLRALHLSTEAYGRLMRELSRLLEAEPAGGKGVLPCKVALLGFAGPLEENSLSLETILSFVPPQEPIPR